ncbi:MAG: ABC transporter substrate-binding protein [Dehalococcoidia bacterium]|nr:ABC transporter substrate-binding protein [Dehalococcoidia bacterium]
MRELYRPRWPLLLALVAGVGTLIALAYVPSEPAGEARPAPGGSYVEGVAGEPSVVNPLFAGFNEVDRDLTSLVFSGLVRLGPKGEVQPDLADEPVVTPDGLTYIFELHPGLTWHDRQPLEADDVAFTIAMIQDPEFQGDPVLAELFQDVQVEVQDVRTISMTLPQAFAPFLARGATVGILPEHLLGGLSASELGDAAFNEQPVGTGPFRLVDLAPTGAVLEPFEAYQLDPPFLQRLELRFYRDDAALLNALQEEEVDGALFRPGLGEAAIAGLDDDSRWVRRSLHATTYSLVYLNPQVPAFDNSLVRRALQHGLDRQALIDEVLDGQALLLDSPIARDLWAYVGLPDAYAFDPEQRRATPLTIRIRS